MHTDATLSNKSILTRPAQFSEMLYEKMQAINPGIADLALYEFRYALENLVPKDGWDSLVLKPQIEIEKQGNDPAFYQSIQLKPLEGGRTVLDTRIAELTQMLFVGLVSGYYPPEWLRSRFYFDIRCFFFLYNTEYFTTDVLTHLGGRPYRQFPSQRSRFEHCRAIGYQDFAAANYDLHQFFFKCVEALIEEMGTPLIIGIAGATAAGKSEITAQLTDRLLNGGKQVCSIEMDNFFSDRDPREQKGINSSGKEALHYALFLDCLERLRKGETVFTPVYDFISGNSSHDEAGKLKPGCSPLQINPADIIFIEGNFPFLFPEVQHLVGIKVLYLTDDETRLKRKWRRDMDLRKKYEFNYYRNRYFREQFLMYQQVFLPQLLNCDLVVETNTAALWVSDPIRRRLSVNLESGEKKEEMQ